MRGAGLIVVLLLALVTSVVFAADPLLDLEIAAYFQRPDIKEFLHGINPFLAAVRDLSTAISVVCVLLPVCAIAIKLIWPRGPMLMPARAAILIMATFALAPGLLANVILKSHWHRPRPPAIIEFGGSQPFEQWWDIHGACSGNCSFVSGEASAAFALLAPAAIVPPAWRYPAMGAVLVYGTAIGLVRVAVGRHFLTDIIFASVFTGLIVWILHGFLFRWKWTRLREASLDRMLEKAGLALRSKLGSRRNRAKPAA
jgi:lipid A 4'-phosphatase